MPLDWWRSADVAAALLPDLEAMVMAVIALHFTKVVFIVAAEEFPMTTVPARVAAPLLAFPMGVVRTFIMVIIFSSIQQRAQVPQIEGAHAACFRPGPWPSTAFSFSHFLGPTWCLLWRVLLECSPYLLNR